MQLACKYAWLYGWSIVVLAWFLLPAGPGDPLSLDYSGQDCVQCMSPA